MKGHRFHNLEEAEAAFYDAFECKDLEAMMRAWAMGEDVECVHPMGPRLSGFEAVRESWRRIFADGVRHSFRIGDARTSQNPRLAIHLLHEHIITTPSAAPYPPVIATNVYRLTNEGWRMILHHASPAPARRQADTRGSDKRQMH